MNNLDVELINLSISDEIKYIDLFAGTGAFSHACKDVSKDQTRKFKCVFANDMEDSSEKIYTLNHGNIFTLGDLNNIQPDTIPSFDLLIGGFPCQPFSIAGERKGFEDKRSNVFWKVLELINVKKPRYILLENVKNLISHDNKNTLKTILSELSKLDYFVKYKILDTCEITRIPHHRERIYIVGFSSESDFNKFNFPSKNENDIDKVINYLEKYPIPDKYYYTSKLKVFEEVERNVINHISKDTVYQYRRYYVRENKNNLVPTLTANMGSGGHNVPLIKDDIGIRKLTPRECFNLQGFPKDYKLPDICDSKLYKLAGNAVSVPVVKKILKKIYEIENN